MVKNHVFAFFSQSFQKYCQIQKKNENKQTNKQTNNQKRS